MKIKIEGYYGEIWYPSILEKENKLTFYPTEYANPDDLIDVPLPEWMITAIGISNANAFLRTRLDLLYE